MHEMRLPSNRQLNSAISEDKIKTENIQEGNTVTETQRQDFQ